MLEGAHNVGGFVLSGWFARSLVTMCIKNDSDDHPTACFRISYAAKKRILGPRTRGFLHKRGIIRRSTLWQLCRHRHNCHWTRHSSRLDRDFGRKAWGDEGYAREELVAELGSAFLAADLGLYLEPREDHASYISSWLATLKDDKRAIFSAASHAQRAVDYLHHQRAKASADIIENAA